MWIAFCSKTYNVSTSQKWSSYGSNLKLLDYKSLTMTMQLLVVMTTACLMVIIMTSSWTDVGANAQTDKQTAELAETDRQSHIIMCLVSQHVLNKVTVLGWNVVPKSNPDSIVLLLASAVFYPFCKIHHQGFV